MDNASLKPLPSLHHHHRSTRSPSPSSTSSAPSQSLSSSRTSTRPSTSSLVRPAPARKGQPASSRNFAASSAGGATSHLSLDRDKVNEKNRHHNGTDLSEQQQNKVDHWKESYIPSEETIRNDYSAEYVETGQRPQNFIRNAQVETRFSEYPKLASLLAQKHALTSSPRYSIPPTYINPSTSTISSTSSNDEPSTSAGGGTAQAISDLISSSARFDSILLTPPPSLSFDALSALPISSIASNPGFIWLWVGSGQKTFDERGEVVRTDGIGLEKGRELLAGWGYRRCEDIVWLKSNKKDPEADLTTDPTSLFSSTIEHCLMGIRGTVRRSTDSWFVHCNVDTDVLVWEGDDQDPNLKPPELQSLIENFCLGTRRLHLFGSKHALRRGWLTVASAPSFAESGEVGEGNLFSKESKVQTVEKEEGVEWEPTEWNEEGCKALWEREGAGRVSPLLPFSEELDALRPKSPPPRNGQPSSGGLGRGRGAGLGITRSGLVTQASPRGPVTSGAVMLGVQNGATNGNGSARGRGRGLGHGGNPHGMASNNGFEAPPSLSTSTSYSSLSSSRSNSYLNSSTSSSSNGSPYRVHSLAPPVAPSHPLPSRPNFVPRQSSSSSSTHSSRYNKSSNSSYLAPPIGAQHGRRPQAQPEMNGFVPSPYSHPPQFQQPPSCPSPEQFAYLQQQQFQQQQAYQFASAPNSLYAPPPLYPPHPGPPTSRFSNLSLSPAPYPDPLFPISSGSPLPIPPAPYPIPPHYSPSPSISPAISPAMSHMIPPPSSTPTNPYLYPPNHPHPHSMPPPHSAPSLSSSSSASSLNVRYGYGGGAINGEELEYPIGGPGSKASNYA
ncbi:uncharacterized protein JCM6883_003266 [Sporobolomyces salmoneus]|uniref:uncharacterized protein n=1 Tax=Sporobolomyces salmoneus TaxID=183962 RepID=UPI0031723DA2